jgi:hypothetical protein
MRVTWRWVCALFLVCAALVEFAVAYRVEVGTGALVVAWGCVAWCYLRPRRREQRF